MRLRTKLIAGGLALLLGGCGQDVSNPSLSFVNSNQHKLETYSEPDLVPITFPDMVEDSSPELYVPDVVEDSAPEFIPETITSEVETLEEIVECDDMNLSMFKELMGTDEVSISYPNGFPYVSQCKVGIGNELGVPIQTCKNSSCSVEYDFGTYNMVLLGNPCNNHLMNYLVSEGILTEELSCETSGTMKGEVFIGIYMSTADNYLEEKSVVTVIRGDSNEDLMMGCTILGNPSEYLTDLTCKRSATIKYMGDE